jgi:hypothetical protein
METSSVQSGKHGKIEGILSISHIKINFICELIGAAATRLLQLRERDNHKEDREQAANGRFRAGTDAGRKRA